MVIYFSQGLLIPAAELGIEVQPPFLQAGNDLHDDGFPPLPLPHQIHVYYSFLLLFSLHSSLRSFLHSSPRSSLCSSVHSSPRSSTDKKYSNGTVSTLLQLQPSRKCGRLDFYQQILLYQLCPPLQGYLRMLLLLMCSPLWILMLASQDRQGFF